MRYLADTLRHAAVTSDYREYLETKYKWTTDDSYDVNWNATRLAIKQTKTAERKTLHDWLPYHAVARRGHVLSEQTLCPFCHQDWKITGTSSNVTTHNASECIRLCS